MKELSIEEKAKAYDEAIEKFDVILNLNTVKESGTIFADDVRKIFPELKESEDEKMIQYFKDLAPFDKADELYEKYGFSHKDAISWLEKQGGHAKFINGIQVGDKVTRNEDGVLVNLSQLNRVAKKDEKQGKQKPNPCENCDIATNNCQKFPCTIRDGKQKPAWSEEDEMMLEGTIDKISDLGAGKMCKEWLKSLKDKVQPQQEWSEEDEENMNHLIESLSHANPWEYLSNKGYHKTILVPWLKSLKELKGE